MRGGSRERDAARRRCRPRALQRPRPPARVLRRPGWDAVPRRGDRRDRPVPARGQRERRRALRDLAPDRRGGRCRARARRRVPRLRSRRGRVRPEHDRAQLPPHPGTRARARGGGRGARDATRPRRQRRALACARRGHRDRRPLRRRRRGSVARPRRPRRQADAADEGRRLPRRRELRRHGAQRPASRGARARCERARLGRRRPLRAARADRRLGVGVRRAPLLAVQVLRAAHGARVRPRGAASELAAVQGPARRRRAGRSPLRARHVPARAARGLRRGGRLRPLARLGRDHRPRALARPAVSRRLAGRRRPARPADDGRARADVLLQRPGPHRAVRRGASRRAGRCRVVGELLRARDDAAARARRARRRRPRRHRPLQHRRGGRPAARRRRGARGVRLLLLGGPKFVGRAVIDAARERGHEVTLFNRGTTGADLYPELERIVGDRDGGLEGLRGREWDAVVDTSGYLPRVVGESARLLADAVGHYVFVSSISVYASFAEVVSEGSALAELSAPGSEDISTDYGALKALCEREVDAAFQARSTAVRAGLIVGPYDPTGRFTYWPHRIARGGDVLVPRPAWRPVQFVDVRDLAAWIVTAAEERLTGPFNATGPTTMGAVIDAARRVSGASARPVEVDDAFLAAQGVGEWMELPLWVDVGGEMPSVFSVDNSRATGAGLTFRPLDDTVAATLADAGLVDGVGLTPERETELLTAWWSRGATGDPAA